MNIGRACIKNCSYLKILSYLSLLLSFIFLAACQPQKSKHAIKPIDTSHITPIMLAPLSEWQERTFNGTTQYSLIENNILKAHTNNSASMIYKAINIDLEKTPYLHWQWKITNTYNNIDETTRAGDDYPARIYIAIKAAPFSFYPRALNYVWASYSEKLSHWKSPYTDQSIMVALQSGERDQGEWVSETRNIRQDLQVFFGEDILFIEGIAIMADGDNSKSTATSFYRNIFFSNNVVTTSLNK